MNKNEKQIKPMLCPVCGEFYFPKLFDYEIEFGETPNDVQCFHCGWYYDLEQLADPDLENQSNAMSFNQYKAWYQDKLKENPKYDYSEEHCPPPAPHMCPVCGEYEFPDESSYDICPSCGWNDDGYFEGGGANDMSLEEAIANFKAHRAKDPNYKWWDPVKKQGRR